MSQSKQNNRASNKGVKNNLIFPILAGLILAITVPFGAKTYKKILIGGAFEKLDNPNGWTGKYECLNKTPTTGTVTFKFSKWSDGTIRIISNFSRINKGSNAHTSKKISGEAIIFQANTDDEYQIEIYDISDNKLKFRYHGHKNGCYEGYVDRNT